MSVRALSRRLQVFGFSIALSTIVSSTLMAQAPAEPPADAPASDQPQGEPSPEPPATEGTPEPPVTTEPATTEPVTVEQQTPEEQQPAEQTPEQQPAEQTPETTPQSAETSPEKVGTPEPAQDGSQPSEEQPSEPKEPAPQPEPPQPPAPAEPRRLPSLGNAEGPMLPGQPWRVHDFMRPRPRVVSPPADVVTTPPPGDAQVLFDGTDLSLWAHHDREDPATLYEAQWEVRDGYFEVKRGGGDLFTIDNFGDVQLHIEWATPENPRGASQGRGNSGIKFLGLYEVQILDSFNNLTYADGQAGAIYGQYPPDVNVSRGPGQWQTFDIIFEMPKFEGDKVLSPAYLTVFHNGALVHLRRPLAGVTGMRSPGKYSMHPPAGPIMLQDHGNPIRFRNIWVRRLD